MGVLLREAEERARGLPGHALPVDDDVPDIRCLGVMVAEGEVGGDETILFGARAMKVPHLRGEVARLCAHALRQLWTMIPR